MTSKRKPGRCPHSFEIIRFDTTLILWNCVICHSGPHWWIYECTKCKFKTCRACKDRDAKILSTNPPGDQTDFASAQPDDNIPRKATDVDSDRKSNVVAKRPQVSDLGSTKGSGAYSLTLDGAGNPASHENDSGCRVAEENPVTSDDLRLQSAHSWSSGGSRPTFRSRLEIAHWSIFSTRKSSLARWFVHYLSDDFGTKAIGSDLRGDVASMLLTYQHSLRLGATTDLESKWATFIYHKRHWIAAMLASKHTQLTNAESRLDYPAKAKPDLFTMDSQTGQGSNLSTTQLDNADLQLRRSQKRRGKLSGSLSRDTCTKTAPLG